MVLSDISASHGTLHLREKLVREQTMKYSSAVGLPSPSISQQGKLARVECGCAARPASEPCALRFTLTSLEEAKSDSMRRIGGGIGEVALGMEATRNFN